MPLPNGAAITTVMKIARKKNSPYEGDEQRWSALMVSAQLGDESDYKRLLTELSNVINHYLRSRFGRHHFIEDCVQDCLIAIHQARHSYDSRRLFRPWLFAIVRHKAIDTLRRQKSYQHLLDQQFQNGQLHTEAQPCQKIENSMIQGSLIEALAPNYREAITLTKIIGLSTVEAASKLSISESALKVRVHRAMSRLKKLLESDEV